jgi:hypothetical protein
VPFFFKQWGEFAPGDAVIQNDQISDAKLDGGPGLYFGSDGQNWQSGINARDLPGCIWLDRVGKKAAGNLLDGRQHLEYPA